MSYLILSLTVIFLSMLYEDGKRKRTISRGTQRVLIGAIVLLLCLFAGLRNGYNDTVAYIGIFRHTPSDISDIFVGKFSISRVYLFGLWNYIVYHFVSANVHVYFFLSSLLFVLPAVLLIKKYSRSFSFSMLLFMMAELYLFSLAGLKQAMAMGLILIALPFLFQKRYLRYYFFCLLAIGFHSYSLLFLLLPLLGAAVLNKRTVFASIGILIVGVGFSFFSGIISDLIQLLGENESVEVLQSGSVNVLRALVYLVPVVLILMGRRKIAEQGRAESIFIKMGIFSSMFMILALFGNPILFGRIPYYFQLGSIISFPFLIENAVARKDRMPLYAAASACYVIFGLYGLYIDGVFSGDIFKFSLL